MNQHIVWKSLYSVGHRPIDDQHKQIIGIINELYTAMGEDHDRAVLKPLLDRLLKYVDVHFQHEERVMQECGYPGLAEHKVSHDQLRQRTADLRKFVGLVKGPDLLRFLKEWWVNHIQDEDQKYAPYLGVAARL